MCGGGGGGRQGPSPEEQRLVDEQNRQNQDNFNRSQALAEQQFAFQQEQANLALAREHARQGRITGAVHEINGVQASRDGIFDSIEDATFNINRDDLVSDRNDGRLALKHNLARAGLQGSSVEVDRNQRLQDRFNEGLQDARLTAQTAANNARLADAQVFGSLVSAASTGNFSGSDLLNSASGALASTANTAPVIVPQFANDTFFTDIVSGLGNIGFQLGQSNPFAQNRTRSTVGGGNNGTVRGG